MDVIIIGQSFLACCMCVGVFSVAYKKREDAINQVLIWYTTFLSVSLIGFRVGFLLVQQKTIYICVAPKNKENRSTSVCALS